MNRFGLLLVGSLALGTAFEAIAPATAAAQTSGTGASTVGSAYAFSPNVEVKINGKEVVNAMVAFVKAADCTDKDKFDFKLTSYPSTPINNLEMWASAGTATDCSQAANRTVNATTPRSPCWYIKTQTMVAGEADFSATATELFRDGSADETLTGDCPKKGGDKYTIYFVPLDTSTDSSPSSPPAPAMVVTRTATFSLYTSAPNAPGGVTGKDGEYGLTVSWSKAAGAVATSTYRAYFDTSVGTDSSCANSQLVMDDTAPTVDNRTLFQSGSEKGMSTTFSNLDQRMVPIGNYVAAAVVHRDFAGNDSALSEVVCIKRQDVWTFTQACNADPECADGFDSCSVAAPGLRKGGLIGLSLLLGLGVAVSVRRRRHV